MRRPNTASNSTKTSKAVKAARQAAAINCKLAHAARINSELNHRRHELLITLKAAQLLGVLDLKAASAREKLTERIRYYRDKVHVGMLRFTELASARIEDHLKTYGDLTMVTAECFLGESFSIEDMTDERRRFQLGNVFFNGSPGKFSVSIMEQDSNSDSSNDKNRAVDLCTPKIHIIIDLTLN